VPEYPRQLHKFYRKGRGERGKPSPVENCKNTRRSGDCQAGLHSALPRTDARTGKTPGEVRGGDLSGTHFGEKPPLQLPAVSLKENTCIMEYTHAASKEGDLGGSGVLGESPVSKGGFQAFAVVDEKKRSGEASCKKSPRTVRFGEKKSDGRNLLFLEKAGDAFGTRGGARSRQDGNCILEREGYCRGNIFQEGPQACPGGT